MHNKSTSHAATNLHHFKALNLNVYEEQTFQFNGLFYESGLGGCHLDHANDA